MTKEALKLALEAFGEINWSNNSQWQSDRAKVAIATLKEALAQPEQEPTTKAGELRAMKTELWKQPEQEPVAWIWEKEDGYTSIETHSLDDEDMKNVGVKSIKPLYAKPQFIGLTDDEILSISADCASSHQHTDIHFARAIEAALKLKNS
jgi:hypothetical protein